MKDTAYHKILEFAAKETVNPTRSEYVYVQEFEPVFEIFFKPISCSFSILKEKFANELYENDKALYSPYMVVKHTSNDPKWVGLAKLLGLIEWE